MTETRFRTCPFCEATCGLAIELDGERVVGVRGDEQDVFSRGYLCPKAYALKELHHDPDRLRTPLVRRGGKLVPASWEEADALVDEKLRAILAAGGPDAVGIYLGNPSAHNLALILYSRALILSLKTRNLFSASTVDQMPKQVTAGLMFGALLSIPIPDVERTDFLLMLGANPFVSNGSLMTAPDLPGKLRAIKARGGQVIVVDPQRTRTAKEATAHHFIRPGTDAHLLFAMVHVLFEEKLCRPGRLAEHTIGIDEVAELARPFTPEAAAARTGIAAETIRELARGLARARRPSVYGRIGTCTQSFGTLASWLVDVLNVLVGALDHEGGAMFTRAAAGSATAARGGEGRGKGFRLGRHASRVRGVPEACGELPAACIAEEIETPGPGQLRGLITIAGNPVLSTPNGARLERALDGLELLVCLDIYENETTRHATVVYPGLSPLEQSHYDIALRQLSVRNVASYSPPVLPAPAGQRPEWHTLLKLAGMVQGAGPGTDVAVLDDFVAAQLAGRGGGASSIFPDGVRSTSGMRGSSGPRSMPCGAASRSASVRRYGPARSMRSMRRSGPTRVEPSAPAPRADSCAATRSSSAPRSAVGPAPWIMAASRRTVCHSGRSPAGAAKVARGFLSLYEVPGAEVVSRIASLPPIRAIKLVRL